MSNAHNTLIHSHTHSLTSLATQLGLVDKLRHKYQRHKNTRSFVEKNKVCICFTFATGRC